MDSTPERAVRAWQLMDIPETRRRLLEVWEDHAQDPHLRPTMKGLLAELVEAPELQAYLAALLWRPLRGRHLHPWRPSLEEDLDRVLALLDSRPYPVLDARDAERMATAHPPRALGAAIRPELMRRGWRVVRRRIWVGPEVIVGPGAQLKAAALVRLVWPGGGLRWWAGTEEPAEIRALATRIGQPKEISVFHLCTVAQVR